MKKYLYTLLLMTSSLHTESTHSPHVITMTLKEYPTTHAQNNPDTQTKPNVDGIQAAYYGFLSTTGHDGDLLFPRRHQEPTITLLISTDTEPVFMASNTIGFFQLNNKAEYALYLLEKKQDKETEKWIWDVAPMSPPKDGRLPINTVVLFAHPTTIYVPVGISMADSNNQLVLPTIYVKETINRPEDTLKAFELSPFFRRLTMAHKKEPVATQPSGTPAPASVQTQIQYDK